MCLLFFHFLRNVLGFDVPAVFFYFSTRMMLASITSLLITIVFGKFFIKKLYELKIGERVRTEECPLLGELHRNKNNVPTMGGILIIFSLLVSLILWMNLQSSFTVILLLTTLVIGSLGATDDYLKLKYKNKKGIPMKGKLVVQAIFSLSVAVYVLFVPINEMVVKSHNVEKKESISNFATSLSKNYATRLYIPFIKKHVLEVSGLGVLLMALFIMIVITGSSNAVNLTDGLDGLATGCTMFVAAAFAVIAFVSNHTEIANYLNMPYIENSGEIAIYLSALVGASLGFLWYNSHPAQVFMGDTGSMTLGSILGVSAVMLRKEILLAMIGGVFVIEALSVILQVCSYKFRNKKRLFLCSPLHHHFEYKGLSETKIVTRFWIIGILLAIFGIATLKFQ